MNKSSQEAPSILQRVDLETAKGVMPMIGIEHFIESDFADFLSEQGKLSIKERVLIKRCNAGWKPIGFQHVSNFESLTGAFYQRFMPTVITEEIATRAGVPAGPMPYRRPFFVRFRNSGTGSEIWMDYYPLEFSRLIRTLGQLAEAA